MRFCGSTPQHTTAHRAKHSGTCRPRAHMSAAPLLVAAMVRGAAAVVPPAAAALAAAALLVGASAQTACQQRLIHRAATERTQGRMSRVAWGPEYSAGGAHSQSTRDSGRGWRVPTASRAASVACSRRSRSSSILRARKASNVCGGSGSTDPPASSGIAASRTLCELCGRRCRSRQAHRR